MQGGVIIHISWEKAKKRYKGYWVIFKNPLYADEFHMNLTGGELVGTAKTQSEMFDLIEGLDAEDADTFTGRHTQEEEAVGTLMSSI